MKSVYVSCIALCSILLAGCIQNQPYSSYSSPQPKETYSVDESKSSYSDKSIEVKISPRVDGKAILGNFIRYFTLYVKNKTANDIRLIWNESYFLDNGEAKGGFMFEGIKYADRNASKQDMLVLPNSSITKDIFPNINVILLPYDRTAISLGIPTGWAHGPMRSGEFGVYLKFIGSKYESRVRLTMNIQKD